MAGLKFNGPIAGRTVRRSVAFLGVTLLAATSACSEPAGLTADDLDELPLLDAGSVVRVPLGLGLEQTLQLEPNRLHPGDGLRIRSVVRNVSREYQKAEALVCQLEIRTNMNFQNHQPLILCFAYSMTVRLAPRDSLVLTAGGIVKSRPGTYIMVVRHLLRPDLRVRVRVRVHPNPATDLARAGIP